MDIEGRRQLRVCYGPHDGSRLYTARIRPRLLSNVAGAYWRKHSLVSPRRDRRVGYARQRPDFCHYRQRQELRYSLAKSNWSGLLCFAHTLQLCINDAKREVASFSQLCVKCRSIVGRYKRSMRARARLMDIQKDMHMAQHEVIQDVPTRWNNEYAMMERLVELHAPISVELCHSDVDNLSSREWKLMAAAMKVLQPLDQAMTELCADCYPTLSQLIPLMHYTQVVLHEHVSEGEEVASFARSLLRSLATRFPGLKMVNVPANAMLVDPRYKDICYTEDSQKKWAKATLAAVANELMPAQNDCAWAPVCPAMEKPPANTLWSVFSSLTSNVLQDKAHESVPSQVAEYLGAPVLSPVRKPFGVVEDPWQPTVPSTGQGGTKVPLDSYHTGKE